MDSIILAGGENRRIPVIKGLIVIDGKTIMERVLEVHREFSKNIMISTNDPNVYYRFGEVMIGDVLDVRGPMTGIYSGMLNGSSEWFLVTACDMPYIDRALIAQLVPEAGGSDAVVPVFDGEPQPLCGLYNISLLERLYDNIIGNRCGMRRFLDEIDTTFVDEGKVRAVDPDGRSFVNINTIEDLKRIEEGGGKCSD